MRRMISIKLSGAKFLTTYEMHYQTDGNTFSFIKGRWVGG